MERTRASIARKLDARYSSHIREGWIETPHGLVPPGWAPITEEAKAAMAAWTETPD